MCVLRCDQPPLQRDYVLAISRGGRYTLDNMVPACGSCNASKCNDELTGWLRRRLDEQTFLLRHLGIGSALRRSSGLVHSSAEAPAKTARERRG